MVFSSDLASLRGAVPSTSAFCDALDHLGLTPGALSDLQLRGAVPAAPLVGRARVGSIVAATPSEPDCPGLTPFMEGAQPGDILVLEWLTDAKGATFGGNAVKRAADLGIVALVVDGWIRDLPEWEMDDCRLTAYCRGNYPVSGKGRINAVMSGEPVHISGIAISSGDLIVLDTDGVCVVPSGEELEVIEEAKRVEVLGAAVRKAVANGASPLDAHQSVERSGGDGDG